MLVWWCIESRVGGRAGCAGAWNHHFLAKATGDCERRQCSLTRAMGRSVSGLHGYHTRGFMCVCMYVCMYVDKVEYMMYECMLGSVVFIYLCLYMYVCMYVLLSMYVYA